MLEQVCGKYSYIRRNTLGNDIEAKSNKFSNNKGLVDRNTDYISLKKRRNVGN